MRLHLEQQRDYRSSDRRIHQRGGEPWRPVEAHVLDQDGAQSRQHRGAGNLEPHEPQRVVAPGHDAGGDDVPAVQPSGDQRQCIAAVQPTAVRRTQEEDTRAREHQGHYQSHAGPLAQRHGSDRGSQDGTERNEKRGARRRGPLQACGLRQESNSEQQGEQRPIRQLGAAKALPQTDERRQHERGEREADRGEGERGSRLERQLDHDETDPPKQAGKQERRVGPSRLHASSRR